MRRRKSWKKPPGRFGVKNNRAHTEIVHLLKQAVRRNDPLRDDPRFPDLRGGG